MYKILLIIGLIITITSCNTTNKQKVKAIGQNTYAIDNESDFFFLDTLSNQNGTVDRIDLIIRDSIQLTKPIVLKDKEGLSIHIRGEKLVNHPCIMANNTPCLIIDNCIVSTNSVDFTSSSSDCVIRCSNTENFEVYNGNISLLKPFSEDANAINIKQVKKVYFNNGNLKAINAQSAICVNQTSNFSLIKVSFSGNQKHNLILENNSNKNVIKYCNFKDYTETAIYTTDPELEVGDNNFQNSFEYDTESLISYPDSITKLMFPWDDLIYSIFHNDYEYPRYGRLETYEDPDIFAHMPYANGPFKVLHNQGFDEITEEYYLYEVINQFVEDNIPEHSHLFEDYFVKDFSLAMKIMTGIPVFNNKNNNIADEWCYNEEGEAKFLLYNPDFFKWLRKSLKIDNTEPEEIIEQEGEHTEEQTWWVEDGFEDEIPESWDYFDIYNNMFRDLFRNYYIIYKYLYDAENTEEIISLFKHEGDKSNWFSDEMAEIMLFKTQSSYTISFEYNDSLQLTGIRPNEYSEELQSSFEYLTYYGNVDIKNHKIIAWAFPEIGSFWMRRTLDGSAPELFKTLEHYMHIFDEEWINTFNDPNGPVTNTEKEETLTLGDPGCVKYGEPDSIYTVNESNTYKLFFDEDDFSSGIVSLCLEKNPNVESENLGNCKLYVIFEDEKGNTDVHHLYDASMSFSKFIGKYHHFIEEFLTHTDDVKNGFYYTDDTSNENKLMRFLPEDIADGKYKIQIAIYVEDENITIYSNVVKADVPLQAFTG